MFELGLTVAGSPWLLASNVLSLGAGRALLALLAARGFELGSDDEAYLGSYKNN